MPLKVIGAGFGRTGTMTLKHALEQLGYGPCYHMIELTNNPANAGLWLKAARQQTVDWEKLFGPYQSITDFPGCLFYKELLAAYPEALVILTIRDADEWYDSARKTIFKSYPSLKQLLYIVVNYAFKKRVRQLMQVGWLIQKTIFRQTFKMKQLNRQKAIAAYRKHIEEVKAHVPAEQLLVYNVKEGWDPLCHFLKVPVPPLDFPNTNRSDHFLKMKNITLKKPVSQKMKGQ